MGGYSYKNHSLKTNAAVVEAFLYSLMEHQRLVSQGKADPMRLPPLPDRKPPPPRIVHQPVEVRRQLPAPAAKTAAPPPQQSAAPTPQEPPRPDPQGEAARRRVEQLERQPRGRAGTVATSWRGVLSPLDDLARRKTLLGE